MSGRNIGFGPVAPLTRRQFIGAAAGLSLASSGLALPARSLTINPRESWAEGLDPKGPLQSEDVRFLIVHHSASFNGHTPAQVPDILRGWFNFHTGSRGWNDIAYNFVIDSEGGVWEARKGSIAGPVAGDATGGNQGYTQLVCVIGDTNTQAATPAAHASLVSVLAWLGDRYGVSTANGAEVTFESRGSNKWPAGTSVTTPTIAGHRDMSKTSCPGDSLYSYVTGSLMSDVESARGGSPPPTSPTTTSTSSTTTTSTSTTTSSTTSTTTTSSTSTTTTVPSTTTSVAPTTTVAEATSTLAPSSTTAPPPTTIPLAIPEEPESDALPAAVAAIAAGFVVVGAGILAWRARRMS